MVKLNSVLVFPVIVLLYDCFSIVLSDVGDRAKAECRKYGSELVECQRKLKGVKTRVPADILAFPHMVMLGYKTNASQDISYQCGGSLISPSWILSAAHCVGDRRVGDPVRVRLGTTTLEIEEEEEDAIQERGLSRLVVHPNYKPPAKYNDIALLQMDQPIDMDGDVRIACLSLDHLHIFKAKASGFGKTQHDNMDGSKTMMEVELDIISQLRCNKSLKSMIRRGGLLKQGIQQSQICAGDLENGGKDTCQGDSGGPLQFLPENPDCVNTFPLYVIVGVTSFGRFCGFKNSPGVYTRVSFFVEWIENIVWPENELTTVEKSNNNNIPGKELKMHVKKSIGNESETKSTETETSEVNDLNNAIKTDGKATETENNGVNTDVEATSDKLPAIIDTVVNSEASGDEQNIKTTEPVTTEDKKAMADKLSENNENINDQEAAPEKSLTANNENTTDSVAPSNTTPLSTKSSGVANDDIKMSETKINKPIFNRPTESKTPNLPIRFTPLFKETSATETPKATVISNTKTNNWGRNWISNSILSIKKGKFNYRDNV